MVIPDHMHNKFCQLKYFHLSQMEITACYYPSLKKDKVQNQFKLCRPYAAPGTDSITAYFYQQNWDLLVDHLTEVIQQVFLGNTPTPSKKRALMVFGNKLGKKPKSLLISDRRKLSLLNVDFKIRKGIKATRI